jgi:hypothetical protein
MVFSRFKAAKVSRVFFSRKRKQVKVLAYMDEKKENQCIFDFLLKMKKFYPLSLLILFTMLMACKEETEPVLTDLGFDFKPLALGNIWIYEVDETIHYGENDFEISSFFYQDRIRGSYLNEEKDIVFIVERLKSTDRKVWTKELDYTLQNRNGSLLRTINNQIIVALSLPPDMGKKWDGNAFRAARKDEFEIDSVSTQVVEGKARIQGLRVTQEKLDDKVTQRDNRYEIYQRSVGMVEKYDEVLTYCSRNNCLGQQLIDGGYKIKMKLIDYEIR